MAGGYGKLGKALGKVYFCARAVDIENWYFGFR